MIYRSNAIFRKMLTWDEFRVKPIMLDHSCFLTKNHEPIPIVDYQDIIKQLKPDIVIMPDAISNFQQTLDYTNEYYEPLTRLAQIYDFKLIGIPQGKTIAEIQTLLDIFNDRDISLIGLTTFLPYEITKNNPIYKQRKALLDVLETFWSKEEWKKFRFHASGLPDARELVWMKQHPLIISCDTSLMFTAGLTEKSLMRAKRAPLNFKLLSSEIRNAQWSVINRNIALARIMSH